MKEKKLLELYSFLSLRGTTPRLSFVFHQIQIKCLKRERGAFVAFD